MTLRIAPKVQAPGIAPLPPNAPTQKQVQAFFQTKLEEGLPPQMSAGYIKSVSFEVLKGRLKEMYSLTPVKPETKVDAFIMDRIDFEKGKVSVTKNAVFVRVEDLSTGNLEWYSLGSADEKR